jgi:hypothetical protein
MASQATTASGMGTARGSGGMFGSARMPLISSAAKRREAATAATAAADGLN